MGADEWIAFAGVVIAGLLAIGAFWREMSKRMTASAKYLNERILDIEKEKSRAHAEIFAKIARAETSVHELRIETMRDFASVTHLEKVETRLLEAIGGLTKEIKTLSQAMARMERS